MKTKKIMKLNSRKFNIKNNNNLINKTVSSQTKLNHFDYSHRKTITISNNKNKDEALDWGNYESIYKHIISYINLMIIDLSEDKEILCKYLKDIFYAIFNISQETKNNFPLIINKEKYKFYNDKNNSRLNYINEDWDFLTGDKIKNNDLMEQLLNEELKNDKNVIKPILTQKTDDGKGLDYFRVSPLKIKIDRLQKRFKQKENQFKIDKLKFLFKINEQNELIKKLEKEVQLNNINNISQQDLKKIKCFPDFSNINDKYFKINNIYSNSLITHKNKEQKENININNLKLLNSAKVNNNKELNMKNIFSQNLSFLNNEKKMKKRRYSRFISFSFSDTKLKVEKIKNYN